MNARDRTIEPSMPAGRTSSGRARWLLSAGALAAALFFGEWIVARYQLAPDYKFYPGPFVPHAGYDYALQPGYRGEQGRVPVHINRRGMRDGALAPEASGFRILLLGDSVAFGWGVAHDQTFAHRLEQALRRAGKPVTVMNAAVPGYSPWHYVRYLREHADELEPDLIMATLVENDRVLREWEANRRGTLTKIGTAGLRHQAVEIIFNHPWMSRHSGLYRLLKDAVRRIVYRTYDRQRLGAGLSFLSEARAAVPGDKEVGWRACYRNLIELKEEANEARAPLVVINLTLHGHVYRALDSMDFTFISCGNEAGEKHLLPHDSHPNALGHQSIAAKIIRGLEDRYGPDALP